MSMYSKRSSRYSKRGDDDNNELYTSGKLKKQELTFKDRIILGPVDRYKKYNIFPWKFVIHVVSLIVVSYQATTIVGIQVDFSYNS